MRKPQHTPLSCLGTAILAVIVFFCSAAAAGDVWETDFESGLPSWITQQVGTWSLVSGFTGSQVLRANDFHSVLSFPGLPSDNVAMDVDFSVANGSIGDFAVWVNSTGPYSWRPTTGYEIGVYPAGSDNTSDLIHAYEGLLTSRPNTIHANESHHLSVIRQGDDISVFLDHGTTPYMQVNDSTLHDGTLCIRISGGGAVDNVAVSALVAPPPIAPVKQDINNTGGIFSSKGLGHYSCEFTAQQELVATIRVKLTGDSPTGPGGEDLKNIWEKGIESTWNGQYVAIDRGARYPVSVDVQWVTEDEDFAVTVHNNDGGAAYGVNSLNFCTDDPAGHGFAKQGLVAAHEAGHWLGLLDEYSPENSGNPARWPLFASDGTMLADWWGLYDQPNGQPLGDNDNNGTDDWVELQALADQDGLMGRNGVVLERYYEYLVEWLASETGRNIVLGQAPTFTFRDAGSLPADGELPVPEPASLALLALGGIAVLRRRRK